MSGEDTQHLTDFEQGPLSLRTAIIENVTIAIASLPNGGGVSWNEAREIAEKVARLALSSVSGTREP